MSFLDYELGQFKYFPSNEHGIIICDPYKLYEAAGLPEGYAEFGVEWMRGSEYVITDQNNKSNGLSFRVRDEEGIKKEMDRFLRGSGTYEELKNNKNVSNIRETIEQTDFGKTHIYICDTKIKKDLKITYTEFSYNGVDYIISSQYTAGEHTHQSTSIFAYNGNESFMFYAMGKDNELSFQEITAMYVKLVD